MSDVFERLRQSKIAALQSLFLSQVHQKLLQGQGARFQTVMSSLQAELRGSE